jgi:cell division septum initiation protein DivIVA
MNLRGESGRADGAPGPDETGVALEVPNPRGDLDEMIGHRPVFRTRMQGYDRLEVDNYTAWAEGELIALHRQVDNLLSRYGECSAQLEISRRLLADAPPGREAFPVSQRVKDMLRLAEDEAAAITEAAAQEADRLVAEARTEADGRLRKAHEIKEMAIAAGDEILEQARRDREAAAAVIEDARTQAEQILREAAEEQERLTALAQQEREEAAAAAAARLADVQAEVDDLHTQRDHARQSLRDLTDRIGEALKVVAAIVPEDSLLTHDVTRTNVAVEGMVRDHRDDPGVAVGMGNPTHVPN